MKSSKPDRRRRGALGWMPLRVRITLWVLAIFAVVHITLSLIAVLYQQPRPAHWGPVATTLALALPIGLLATGIATWCMSGIAVRPLRQVQSFAEELSTETLSDDIDLDNASPEAEELREGLEAAMQRLNEGYERQARFLANVSHELKTPISVVRTEAEVLLSGRPTDDDLRRFAKSTADEMQRLGSMVESLLLLTRIRHGSGRIKAERHSANDLLMEAVAQCAAVADEYGVRLVPHLFDGDTEPSIEGNADLLQTALTNLIRNAIRFSPKGHAVEIGCTLRGDRVELSVRDLGPGVPPELVSRLFEPFTQASEERQRGRGNGLGLQISQGIAELHGGEIEVVNLDRGCRFTLNLPAA